MWDLEAMRPDDSRRGRALAALGLSEQEQRLYVALLDHPRSTVNELASLLGVSRRRAETALKGLEVKGAVSRSPERVARYLPAPPGVVVEALIARRQDELQQARLAGAWLEERARRGANGPGLRKEIIEIITGRPAVAQCHYQFEESAQGEVLCFDRPPYATTNPADAPNAVQREALARGVIWRGVYAQEALELPGKHEHVRQMVELGESARVFAQLPLKLEIVDRRVALVPLALDDPELGGALIVRPSSLLDALLVLFEIIWERSTPIRFSRSSDIEFGRPSTSSAKVEALIPLLAAGLKDTVIARQFDLSTRTLERRVSDLMASLDAQTRFQAGWVAALRAQKDGWHAL